MTKANCLAQLFLFASLGFVLLVVVLVISVFMVAMFIVFADFFNSSTLARVALGFALAFPVQPLQPEFRQNSS
jgi:hypothetical protein